MLNSTNMPYVTMLLTSILRSSAPGSWFSSATLSLNIRSGIHTDSHNYASIENILVPASSFERGELWLRHPQGDHVLQDLPGRLLRICQPCVHFLSHTQHATMPWCGNRLLVIGYHIRSPHLLPVAAMEKLLALGFEAYAGHWGEKGFRLDCHRCSSLMEWSFRKRPRISAKLPGAAVFMLLTGEVDFSSGGALM